MPVGVTVTGAPLLKQTVTSFKVGVTLALLVLSRALDFK